MLSHSFDGPIDSDTGMAARDAKYGRQHDWGDFSFLLMKNLSIICIPQGVYGTVFLLRNVFIRSDLSRPYKSWTLAHLSPRKKTFEA